MSQIRSYPKELKLMSIELSNTRTDLPALARELEITLQILSKSIVAVLH